MSRTDLIFNTELVQSLQYYIEGSVIFAHSVKWWLMNKQKQFNEWYVWMASLYYAMVNAVPKHVNLITQMIRRFILNSNVYSKIFTY